MPDTLACKIPGSFDNLCHLVRSLVHSHFDDLKLGGTDRRLLLSNIIRTGFDRLVSSKLHFRNNHRNIP